MRNTKLAEIDLKSGVFSAMDGYAVANKLRMAQNLLPDRLGLKVLRPTLAAPASGVSMANATALLHLFDFGGQPIALGTSGGNFKSWGPSGTILTGGTAKALSSAFPASGVFWNGAPSTPTGFAAHKDVNLIYKVTSSSTWVDYTGTNVPAGAIDLAIHLGRLWMLVILANGNGKLVWTDVISLAVRANSFESIEDNPRCLFRTTPSDVDIGAQSHLCVGCKDSILVLDGDPQLKTAVLRKLEDRKGIASKHLVAETDHGAVCLATDSEFYLIPPGATSMQPLGSPVRNKASGAVGHAGTTFMFWEAPYLYYFRQDETATKSSTFWILDLDEPSAPKWWGPHTHEVSSLEFNAGLRYLDASDNVQLAVADSIDASGGSVQAFVRTLATTQVNRAQKLQTGYFFEPGRDVLASRIILRTKSKEIVAPVTVTCTNNKGKIVSVTKDPLVVPAGTSSDEKVSETIFPFERERCRGEYFFVEITAAAGVAIDPITALVEYRVVGRQDDGRS